MPAFRLANRRRRSSVLLPFNQAKPGIYGVRITPPPQKLTFAPNVTPVSFVESEENSDDTLITPASLFPPSEAPLAASARRRVPPGKRRSLGYIPRPPNAFMLFRADFVRQKHVPGSIETNHGSLSKIIGNCWRALPLEEKRVWEIKAKQAKAEHKARYPNYRFRPVHNKNKDKKKEKMQPTPEDERRCEEVAQLLLEGKKGEQLAEAVRNLDSMRSQTPTVMAPPPVYPHRRSSSVPLPSDYCTPFGNTSLNPQNFLVPSSRDSFSRHQRMMFGQQRRPSSAGPAFFRPWTPSSTFHGHVFQHDELHLPDPDPTLFNTFSNFNFQAHGNQQNAPFSVNELLTSLPPHAQAHDTHNSLGPLEPLAPQDILSHMYNNDPSSSFDIDQAVDSNNSHAIKLPELDISSWLSAASSVNHSQSPGLPSSHSSSSYSGSPQPSDNCLPLPVYAPQPLHADQTTASMFSKAEDIVTSGMWANAVGYGDDNMGGTLGLSFAGNTFDLVPTDHQVVNFGNSTA